MIITLDELKGNVGRLIRFIDENRIETHRDLQRFSGRRYFMRDKKPDFVEVLDKCLIDFTNSRIISYVSPLIQGVPIEGRFNLDKKKSMVIVKSNASISNYSPLAQDSFGNLIQYREIMNIDFLGFRRELEFLEGLVSI